MRLLLLLPLVLFATALGRAESGEVYTVTFAGQGKVTAVPDTAFANFTISATSPKMGQAISDQATKTKTVLGLLKRSGIPAKDIRTTSYAYQPVYEYVQQSGKQVLKGYQASQRLLVLMPVSLVGAVIDGISQDAFVDGIQFAIGDADALRETATNLAIKDAQDKAARRAKELGLSLGPIVGYQEQSPSPYNAPRFMAAAGMKSGDAAPELPAGEAEIVVTVSVTYRLQVNPKD